MHKTYNLSYKGQPWIRLTPQPPYHHLPLGPNLRGAVGVKVAPQRLLQRSLPLCGSHPHLLALILVQVQEMGARGWAKTGVPGLVPIPEEGLIEPEATPQTAIQSIIAG